MTTSGKHPSRAEPDAIIEEDLASIIASCGREMSQLAGKTLLVTGGSGFVGRYLVEAVLRLNANHSGPACSLILVTRDPQLLASRYPLAISAGEIDLVQWGPRCSLDVRDRRPDYVIHAAAPADPQSVSRDPGGSLRDLIAMAQSTADVAMASGARRAVLISSGAVYGDQPEAVGEIPEDFQGGPDLSSVMSVYGEGKRVSELLFRASGVDQRVARVFSLAGPYQDLRSSFAVPNLIRQAAENGSLELTGDGSSVRSYCYSADLTVFLFKLLLGAPRYDVYNVGSRVDTVAIREVAQLIAAIFGGLDVRLQTPNDGSAVSGNRYVPMLDRMYEMHIPQVGLRDGLLRTCHSLYNRGQIDRKPMMDLEPVGPGSRRAAFD